MFEYFLDISMTLISSLAYNATWGLLGQVGYLDLFKSSCAPVIRGFDVYHLCVRKYPTHFLRWSQAEKVNVALGGRIKGTFEMIRASNTYR